MSGPMLRHGLMAIVLLLSAGFPLGCTTVVWPVSTSEIAMADENHGFLFGTIHLTRNDKDQSAGLKWLRDMRWLVTEDSPIPRDSR